MPLPSAGPSAADAEDGGEGRLGESLEPVVEPGDVVGDGSQPGGRVTVIAIRVRREVRRTKLTQELDELVSRDNFVSNRHYGVSPRQSKLLPAPGGAHSIEERLEVIGFGDDLVGVPDGRSLAASTGTSA